MKLLAPLKKFILFQCYSTQPTYIYSKDSKEDERNGDDFSILSACQCSFPRLLCPFWNTTTISAYPSHFSFSSCLPFPFLLSGTLFNVFAKANFYCYPSYATTLRHFDYQIYVYISFTSCYKILI